MIASCADPLIGIVSLHSGLDDQDAAAVTATVLGALGGTLARAEAEALALVLPVELAAPLVRGERARAASGGPAGGGLATRVAAAAQVPLGRAVEHVASVCRALAERLPPAALERLRAALPADTAALFEPPVAAELEPKPHVARHTIAEGRPGSRHPLSEARPRGAQPDSLAASDNPHGETKLSSSRGLTQEREHESLADGRPGPRRSIADGKPD